MAFRTNKTPVLQEKSASGAVATFNTALAMPLVAHKVKINAQQSGSGTPTPLNERPIITVDETTITSNDGITPTVNTISLGKSIYSGELDVINGVLTDLQDFQIKTVTQNSTIDMNESYSGLFVVSTFFIVREDTESVLCNYYSRTNNQSSVGDAYNNNPNYSFCCKTGGSSRNLYIKDTRFNSVADFKAWLVDNPVDILIKKETYIPVTSTTTSLILSTFEGNNEFSANTGDTVLTYKDLDIAKRGNFREVFKLPS